MDALGSSLKAMLRVRGEGRRAALINHVCIRHCAEYFSPFDPYCKALSSNSVGISDQTFGCR